MWFEAINSRLYFENKDREASPRASLPAFFSRRPILMASPCQRVNEAAGQPYIRFASLPIVALRSAARNFSAIAETLAGSMPGATNVHLLLTRAIRFSSKSARFSGVLRRAL